MSDSDSEGDLVEAIDGSFLDVSVSEEVKTRAEKPSCDECGKHFSNKHSLKRHMNIHILPNAIRCSGCHQYFKTEEEKAAHINKKHTNNICHKCGKNYKRMSDLNVHLKSHEESFVAKFSCPFDGCRKIFVKQTLYQDHINVHTGHEPYECQACSSKFKSRYERNNHFKLCAGLKTIKCVICQQTFTHRATLHNHKAAVHSGRLFRCGCGATYKYASGLKRHKAAKRHD